MKNFHRLVPIAAASIFLASCAGEKLSSVDNKPVPRAVLTTQARTSVSLSTDTPLLRNGIDVMRFRYEVKDAPSGSGVEIYLLGAPRFPGGHLLLVSRFGLDGTTRSFDLSVPQTRFPERGEITVGVSYADSLLPAGGPLEINVYGPDGALLTSARTSMRILGKGTP